jgi:hypothetical protein
MDIPEGFEAIPNGFEVVQQPQGRAPDFKDNIPVPRAGTYQEPKGVDDFGEYVKGGSANDRLGCGYIEQSNSCWSSGSHHASC